MHVLHALHLQCARMIVRAHVVIRMPLVLVSLEVKVVRQELVPHVTL